MDHSVVRCEGQALTKIEGILWMVRHQPGCLPESVVKHLKESRRILVRRGRARVALEENVREDLT